MNIEDFLPKYPNINNTRYDKLNPYDNFYDAIFRKKEFYDNKLSQDEPFPKEKGSFTKYQKTVIRFLSSATPYDKLFLIHDMGYGKCVLPETKININNKLYTIENIWNKYHTNITNDNINGIWADTKEKLDITSFDVQNNKIIKNNITKLFRQFINENIKTVITKSGKHLSCTIAHKLYCNESWKNEIKIGDIISTYNEKTQQIENEEVGYISHTFYSGFVYDFEVDKVHNYIANNILTHNTCSAIGSIEQIKNEDNSTFTGALIFARGESLLDNFTRELVEKCTAGQYVPENYNKLTELEKIHRIKRKTKFYQMNTFMKFAKRLQMMSDFAIENEFSNKIIVIDEIHNIREKEEGQDEKDSIETYNQFHRFLHLVKNCKILGLSGTPMKDTPDEMSALLNLFLLNNEQLPTGAEFLEEFMNKDGNSYVFKQDKKTEFKGKLKGLISFIRQSQSSIEKRFEGDSNYDGLKYFTVNPLLMSDFQTKSYNEAYGSENKDKKQGVYIGSREASLFVYPDGSYGRAGFEKYIEVYKLPSLIKNKTFNSYRLTKDFTKLIRGQNDDETLKNIENCSISYSTAIKNILNTDGNCFVYSSLAKGSGAILLSLLLELFGFSKTNGNEDAPGLRYAMLTNTTVTNNEIKRIVNGFNDKKNRKGKYIKVIIGTRAISEGFSFRNVILEIINTPHWNYAETAQAIARGIRLGSHNDLLEQGETPIVRIIQTVSIPNSDKYPSIDLQMYKISEDKDISIRSILRLLMEAAMDCALNYIKNKTNKGKDNSRECDYTICEYGCDGIDMNTIENVIENKDLDYSTYNLYYSNPKTNLILNKIENLFRENRKIDLQSIYKNLKSDYSEDEINNAIFLLQEESNNQEYDYKTFLNLYSRTSVQKIINNIENLFQNNFHLTFEQIIINNNTYSEFEILVALQETINNNIKIKNKYGFNSYLREQNNIYFLVNTVTTQNDFSLKYYTEIPQIETIQTFDSIKEVVFTENLPHIIESIFSVEDEKKFSKLIKIVPPAVQEFIIESAIVAENLKIDKNNDSRKKILEYFNNYIKNINNIYFSTYQNTLRCLDDPGSVNNWKDCDAKYLNMLQKYQDNKEQEIKNNPYELIGKYNPETDAFCIVDFQKEQEMKSKIGEKRKGVDEDKRLNYSGKVCGAGGWKLNELMEIAILRLKIDAPEDFRKNYSKDQLLEDVKNDEKLMSIMDEKTLPTMSKNHLRCALYWGTAKKGGGIRGIKPLCSAIRTWLEENNLLEIDNKCGVQGKKKNEEDEKQIFSKEFRIEEIILTKDAIKLYKKQIEKIAESCGFDEFEIKEERKVWYFVFAKSKLLGFTNINKNKLENVCIYYTPNYRKQNILSQAMCELIKYIKNKNPQKFDLNLDTRLKNFKKLEKIYTDIGFITIQRDDRYIYMNHECN